MNTMETTKIVSGVCASLLVLLAVKYFIAEPLYAMGAHGEHSEPAYKLESTVAEAAPAEAEAVDYAALVAAGDAAAGEKEFSKCKSCHKIEAGANAVGPSLHGIDGRDIGSVAGFGYSEGMAALEGNWDAQRLAEFLHLPKSYVPGTKMSFAGFKDPADGANVAAYLATLK